MIIGVRRSLLKVKRAIVVVTTTFDPAHLGPGVNLSNGNLKATGNSITGGTWSNATGTVYKATGKFYAEVTVGAATAVDLVGIASNSAPTNNYIGSTTAGAGWVNDNRVLIGGSQVATVSSWSTGNVLCIAVDLGNQNIWFRVGGGNWNNNVSANPATNTGGVSISGVGGSPFALGASINANGDNFTVNFGASAYVQAVPSTDFGNWV